MRYNPATPTSAGLQVTRTQRRRGSTFIGVGSRVALKDDHLFLENLPVIDAAVAHVCRRHRLTAAEADDFSADVRLHFIERNYEPLKRFEGRSTLRTYLVVVVNRLFLDSRNRMWGKWRPSVEAARLGPIAILFERLVVRDGWSVEQALEMLRTQHGFDATEMLAPLRLKIAERQPARAIVGESEASEVASDGPWPDANVVRAEQGFLARRVRASLDRARQSLTAEERLILKMRIDEAMPVADIARALHLNQKRLYRTIDRLFADLKRRLEADGFVREDVEPLVGTGVFADDDAAQPAASESAAAPGRVRRGGQRG